MYRQIFGTPMKGPGESAPVVRDALNGLPPDIHPSAEKSRGGERTVRISKTGSFFDSASGRIPNDVGDRISVDNYLEKGIVTGCLGTLHSGVNSSF